MLYKNNNTDKLSEELFKNPTSEYRGAPFWAWNCELTEEELTWQIEQLKKMGFGGFHMHARCGLSTEYLGEEFMELVKSCVSKAKDEKMLAWLYDEDRWPSGAAGGYVTKNPKYRQKFFVFSTEKPELMPKEEAVPLGKPYLLNCYDIILNTDGTLKSGKPIGENDSAEGTKWYAYVTTPEESGWYNNQTYVDTLSKEAMDEFIKVTYEAYKKSVGDEFDKTVPAIFTDEPQTFVKNSLGFATDTTDVKMPWTTDFEKNYYEKYGIDLLEHMPELIWNLPNNAPSRVRYCYHDLASELFAESFVDNCGKWCAENGIALTGHLFNEDSLSEQTRGLGEAMRHYRSFGIPGIDLLSDRVSLNTAKQTQSVCHQTGKKAMLSELYGVTNWNFDFRGHKFQGDWQAALGVSVRVPHLAWVSMKGSAKRDYPASISYQSPWYKEYPYIENHFARLNTALTRGKADVKVAMIHPIESYWLNFGPSESTAAVRNQLEESFKNTADWLLYGTIDFDYISESLLPTQYGGSDNKTLSIGEMEYTAVLISGCETLRSSTVRILKEFAQNGGKVVFVGDAPKYVDAIPSDEIKELYDISVHADKNSISVLNSLEDERTVSIKNSYAAPTDDLIYQLRDDRDVKWLFIAHAKKPTFRDNIYGDTIKIRIRGEYEPVIYDTLSGEVKPVAFKVQNGITEVERMLYANDSLLLQLRKPTGSISSAKTVDEAEAREIHILKPCEYKREEPNVYILDMARYSTDGGKTYGDTEEILRIDQKIRDEFGYPDASGKDAQPWVIPPEKPTVFPWLKFEIESDIATECKLAYEEAEEVILNGEAVEVAEDGYFVDHSIKIMSLPKLKKGVNQLLVRVPISKRISIESFYLIGEFDVCVRGCEKKIVASSDKIGFGSVVNQGMPFYGGNITYKTKVDLPECDLRVRANYYRGALIRVCIDGVDKGIIAFEPYTLDLGHVSKGEHEVEFTLFGNRVNTFGSLHINGDCLKSNPCPWYSPNMWYYKGDKWTYDYQLDDMGIMAAPVFEIR